MEIAPLAKDLKPFTNSPAAATMVRQAAAELAEYFAGQRVSFEVPLDTSGTDFQKKVWAAIAATGFGKQISYGEIAEQIGSPNAARAVGGAVGSNPVPLLIGCHRVMGSAGRLTGYSGGQGLATKRALLDHEGLSYR